MLLLKEWIARSVGSLLSWILHWPRPVHSFPILYPHFLGSSHNSKSIVFSSAFLPSHLPSSWFSYYCYRSYWIHEITWMLLMRSTLKVIFFWSSGLLIWSAIFSFDKQWICIWDILYFTTIYMRRRRDSGSGISIALSCCCCFYAAIAGCEGGESHSQRKIGEIRAPLCRGLVVVRCLIRLTQKSYPKATILQVVWFTHPRL